MDITPTHHTSTRVDPEPDLEFLFDPFSVHLLFSISPEPVFVLQRPFVFVFIYSSVFCLSNYIYRGRKLSHGIMSAGDIVRSFIWFLVRIVCGSVYIAIFVPIGIVINIPPMLYWILLVLMKSKHYDVDKIAPFLSHKKSQGQSRETGRELILSGQPRARPRIFFDGSAWSIGFEMGVCQHLVQAGHTSISSSHLLYFFPSSFELTCGYASELRFKGR